MIKLFQINRSITTLTIALMLVLFGSVHVNAGTVYSLNQFQTILTVHSNELPIYNIGVSGHLVNPVGFDNLVMTNPTGTTILDIKNDISGASEFENNGNFFAWSDQFDTKISGDYTVTVTNIDGSSESTTFNALESDFSSAVPTIINPGNNSIITDATPTLSWEPFASPERGATESLIYFGYHIEVETDGSHAWQTGVLGDITSVEYNFNGGAEPGFEQLIPGNYTFCVGALESRIEDDLIFTRHSRGIIEFSYVPIPGAFWLLGLGLVGLVGFRRRVKK